MTPLESGTRVERIETGEVGTVRAQFLDGYVSVRFDNGRSAQLERASLKEIDAHPTGPSGN